MTILTEPSEDQFPDTIPENRLDLPPDQSGLIFDRSYQLTGAYIEYLQAAFIDPENISDPVVRSKIVNKPWSDDDNTGILIKTVYDWNPTQEETRPAILVNRGDIENHRQAIGNLASRDPVFGDFTFWTQPAGFHIFFAIARTSAEADRLAFETARLLLAMSPIIREKLQLCWHQLEKIGQPAILEESKDHYAVPIVMSYKVDECYMIHQHTPVLKRISHTLFHT